MLCDKNSVNMTKEHRKIAQILTSCGFKVSSKEEKKTLTSYYLCIFPILCLFIFFTHFC